MTSQFEQKVPPLFEQHRAAYLAHARRVAVELGKGGKRITIDEVREAAPPPAGIDPRCMGGVLLRSEWKKVGYLNSGRKTCHGRPVAVFRRREAGE
ncbi:hypothetical protein MPPM_4834 [Methylorubrum populi]|uniref:Uncharacterized protein n=1 Tax=Methylorubrum populi TaxID=223967 RepID=A0A160PIX6_9HYPH|nr:hypothetical protein [Methylorubrum populi]BAU93439.1 hypothetical protein MPPM_4834 [Methylorubrum populi]